MTVRTRFAPSPTGYLHVGGARTALFSYLFARRHGGRFILRIEDTDLERSTAESVNAILEGMAWLGLEYDEGPFYQTKRFDRYNEVIDQLLAKGLAYRCDCPKERLDALRENQMAAKLKPRYDGLCRQRDLDPRQPHVIRFRNPDAGLVVVEDMIRGRMTFDNAELDDLIIRRSDGSPTYNLTVVVDDADMAISHVIRGDDHINTSPKLAASQGRPCRLARETLRVVAKLAQRAVIQRGGRPSPQIPPDPPLMPSPRFSTRPPVKLTQPLASSRLSKVKPIRIARPIRRASEPKGRTRPRCQARTRATTPRPSSGLPCAAVSTRAHQPAWKAIRFRTQFGLFWFGTGGWGWTPACVMSPPSAARRGND